MEIKLEQYRSERVGRQSQEMTVSIQKGGIFSVSEKAFEAWGKPAAATLHYSKGECIVALRGVAKGTSDSYSVRTQKGTRNRLVSGKGFLEYVGLEYKTKLIRVKPLVSDGMLILDLKDEGWKRSDASDMTGPTHGSEAKPDSRRDGSEELIVKVDQREDARVL